MRRLASIFPLVVLLACGGNAPRVARPQTSPSLASVLDVMPRDTAAVLGVDVRALVASPLWAYARTILDGQPAIQAAFEVLRDQCHFDVTRDLRSITAGVNAQLDERKIVFVVDGNLDEASLVACLQALRARNDEAPLRVKTEHRITTLESDDRRAAFGWVTPHTVVLTPESVRGDASVLADLLAQGTGTRDTELARVTTHVPPHSIAWWAMVVPPAMKAKSPEIRDFEWTTFGVWMDERASRMVGDLHAQVTNEEVARRLATTLEQGLPTLANALGLAAREPVWVVGSRGSQLDVHLELAVAELPAVVRAIASSHPVAPAVSTSAPALDEAPPADVAAVPPYADRTPSGLASKLLEPGSGTVHPALQDKVRVEFVGWTSDGKMFNSSAQGRAPAFFPLRGVIPGWTEGLQLMVVGEKRRFWIPEALGYAGQAGKPAGMLVFDVKLLEIVPGPAPLPPPASVAAAPADATREADGLAWKVIRPGSGARPSPHAYFTFHVTTWDDQGVMWQSTEQSGRPYTLSVDRAQRAWRDVLPTMLAGEKRVLWAPAGLTTDLRGTLQGRPVVFELELVSFLEPEPTPPDVAAPPRDAATTASGLASKILRPGTGRAHPGPDATVEVHYSGWTSDGKMFDSSFMRGKPARFPLQGVIPGWTEGLQLMVVGEKRRFWIPDTLAYKGQDGAPQGTLVFDVELLAIDPPATTAPAPTP